MFQRLTRFRTVSNVFLGLALEKQNKHDESERAYNTAAKIKANDPLVWQGLITLYEKQADQKLEAYHNAALRLAEIYMEGYVTTFPYSSHTFTSYKFTVVIKPVARP